MTDQITTAGPYDAGDAPTDRTYRPAPTTNPVEILAAGYLPAAALTAAHDAAAARVADMDGWDYDDQAHAAVDAALPHIAGQYTAELARVGAAERERDDARAELGAAGDALAVVRDAVERIDRALARYDTQQPDTTDVDQVAIDTLLTTTRQQYATTTDVSERTEAIRDLLESWYAAWPSTAVTDPHEPIAAELVRLMTPPTSTGPSPAPRAQDAAPPPRWESYAAAVTRLVRHALDAADTHPNPATAAWVHLAADRVARLTPTGAAAPAEINVERRTGPDGGDGTPETAADLADQPAREEFRWAYRWLDADGNVLDETDTRGNVHESAEQRARRLAANRPSFVFAGAAVRYRIATTEEVVATYPAGAERVG